MTENPSPPAGFPAFNAKSLGPAWEGWESYRHFAESVKTNMRFVRSRRAADFLAEVVSSCGSRKHALNAGERLWRARLGCDEEEIEDSHDESVRVTHIEDRPYKQADMKPIANWQTEGRANPRGIPYLYLATDRDTALAEVRPWIGATISVAELMIQRDLTLIDCSKHHRTSFLSVILDPDLPRENGIWVAIDRAFATPVNKDDEAREYVPTQIIAEAFKAEGFDGVVYKSLLSEKGLNVALFDLDDAAVVSCALYKAGSIHFDFKDQGCQYICAPPLPKLHDGN